MKIEINYGNTIHSDDTIAKYVTYLFENIQALKAFWKETRNEGKFNADLKKLTITSQEYISSEEYFSESDEEPFSTEADF
tara:strand:- start:1629 stop:1868 length:240 start_codon:yes stop_codon:yes gene_type:complete